MRGQNAFLFFLMLITWRAEAQVRVSDQEIKQQGTLIDASREKLLGNYDEATKLYEELIKLDRKNDVAWFELAQVQARQEKYNDAIRSVQKAIELNDNNIWYPLFLLEVYDFLERDVEAAAIYEEMVKQSPKNEEYYFKWAYHLIRAQEIEAAIKVYDKLEDQIGVNSELTTRKHALYLGVGAYKKAEKELEQLIKTYPENTDYLHLLAAFYIQIGEAKQADQVFRNILKLNPKDAKAQLAVQGGASNSNALQNLKPIFANEAINIDLKIKELLPYIQKVAEENDAELAQEALELSALLTTTHPNEAKAFAAHADLLYHSGNLSTAQLNYERTLALDNTVYSVWEQLLYLYGEQKNYKLLIQKSEEAIDLFPNQARLYFLNGTAQHYLGAYEAAIDMLEEASLMSSGDKVLQEEINKQLVLSKSQLK